MKKMYLALAAFLIAATGFSQVKIGVQVIGNASNVSFKSNQVTNVKKPMHAAFGAGIVAGIPVAGNVSLRPSLNFLQKKNSIQFDNEAGKNEVKATFNYIEFPLDIVYTVPMKAARVYFGAGPSVGYGVSGNVKIKGFAEVDGHVVTIDETQKAFEKEENGGAGISRVDISANAIAGVKFTNGLFVNAGYLAGLRNLASEGGTYKNKGIQLTVGYFF